MMDKQSLVTELLRERLQNVKIGIIIKSIEGITPEYIIQKLVTEENKLYVAIVGYNGIESKQTSNYEITNKIERAVLWRSDPECAGKILVFM
jgi:hypothetical protein